MRVAPNRHVLALIDYALGWANEQLPGYYDMQAAWLEDQRRRAQAQGWRECDMSTRVDVTGTMYFKLRGKTVSRYEVIF